MKTYKFPTGLLIVICFNVSIVNALPILTQLKSVNKASVKLKYVFIKEVDSTDKDILKLYDDFTYEFLFFQKNKNKPKVKREKGTYSLKNDKLILDKETKAEIKEHPSHFTYIVNKGLTKAKRFGSSKKETELLYVLHNDEKFWMPTYHDPYFGDITNDKKVTKKIIEKKPEYVPVRVLADVDDNSMLTQSIYREEDNIDPIKLGKAFISRDSLKQLKAIIIVGPVEESTKDYITPQKETAKYLRSMGVMVFEFYAPNDNWEEICKASKGAHILIYSGHGRVASFWLSSGSVSEEMIKEGLKLHKNALVFFNHACESAGSSASDIKDIGSTEALFRVTEYAKPFIDLNAASYYSNNYNECTIPFFTSFFQRGKMKDIYTREATKWTKIENRKTYSYNNKYEIAIASDIPLGYSYQTTIINGKTVTRKIKSFKSYDVAYVGKPNFTVVDLFK